MSKTDFDKRKEILAEFVYYLFDSFIMLLIRSNFHVTASSSNKNRLFYFRHDVWKKATEPAIAQLKASQYEEVPIRATRRLRLSNNFAASPVRLLPKASGFRPIVNLKRRAEYVKGNKRLLGVSTNSVLRPAYKLLSYEQSRRKDIMGGSLFSVADIYSAVKTFRGQLIEGGLAGGPLYFAKVDVTACFDTIPSGKVLGLVQDLMSADCYSVTSFAEVRRPEIYSRRKGIKSLQPRVKLQSQGHSIKRILQAREHAEERLGSHSRNSVFVGSLGHRVELKSEVMELLTEHLARNLVRIGKKVYRQKEGIPQGSVLSSFLCNLFYGRLEKEDLSFVNSPGTILLRLIDDFLLVTIDKKVATRFLEIMHIGIPDYGIRIKPEKSLVNFNVNINGEQVPSTATMRTGFPYCGVLIDTANLNIAKDRALDRPEGRKKLLTSHSANCLPAKDIVDSLTVEESGIPGAKFLLRSTK
jgi:telomerase reverse transcriptase